jgi:hypothetical protein
MWLFAPLSPQEVFRRVSPSVFVVESLNSKGEVLVLGSGVAAKIPTTVNGVSNLFVVMYKHVIYRAVAYRVRKGEKVWKRPLRDWVRSTICALFNQRLAGAQSPYPSASLLM